MELETSENMEKELRKDQSASDPIRTDKKRRGVTTEADRRKYIFHLQVWSSRITLFWKI